MNHNISGLPEAVSKELSNISRIASYLWDRQWAERNAGNISVDFTEAYVNSGIPAGGNHVKASFPAGLAGSSFFVTGSGSRLRALAYNMEEAACIMHINEEGSGYHISWGGLTDNFRPTSELLTHLEIQQFNRINRPDHKAVLHTHPTELILLSHHQLFKDQENFNHSLWKLCPEIRVFVPHGICCAPYALTGSERLAEISVNGLKNGDIVLWEKHGALACGKTLEEAFDFLDVANKGAKMLLLAWSAGFEPEGISPEQLRELEQFF